jgi:transposase
MSGNPVSIQHRGYARLLSENTLYKARARIEQAVGKLKRFKRIALRCEKTAQNYGSFVALALGFILIKSVHTA